MSVEAIMDYLKTTYGMTGTKKTAYNLHLKDGKKCKTYFYKYIVTPHFYGCYGWYKGRLGDYCYDSSYVYTDNLDEVFGERYYNVNLKAGLERFNYREKD